MKLGSLVLLGGVAALLGGCAVYGPPPGYGGYYEQPVYSQPAPAYPSGPVYYQAPQPVYVGPPVFLDFGFGFWGGHGGHGGRGRGGWGGRH